ncbi:hypothetical protein [Lutibacter sp. Hel_I_33_5]|uniref:hypothetical protein n=1 Tax=Lutibacter sp. Hel_I_33_5 TaxID=1566289 RepID=UPI0011AA6731|nr:hypothetical protein [Lutibacter sp. Hel_I_33_5]
MTFPHQEKNTSLSFIKPGVKKNKNLNLLEIDLKELESNQYKKDIGLVFKASGNHNFRNIIDEETNSYIKTSFRAELEWNVLKMGFVYNKVKAKRIKNIIEILKLDSEKVEKQLWRRQFRIDYNFILNKEVINLHTNFLAFENSFFDFLNKLYYQKLIKRERLLKVSNQIQVLKNQLKTVEKENILLQDSVSEKYLTTKKLPLLVVNLDSFSVTNSPQKKQFAEENIRLQNHALNDINLSFYVNQNYLQTPTLQRYFPAVGFRFKAPIRFNNRKKIIKTKIKILQAQETDKSLGRYNLTITYVNEYNEKLKDLRNQYKSWQVIDERIRVLKLLKQEVETENSGLLILEMMEEQFKVLENMLQLKRQLYKVITRFFELNDTNNLNTLFKHFYFDEKNKKQPLLLKESKKYSLKFQLEFLEAKKIREVVLEDNQLRNKLKKSSIIILEKEQKTIKTVENFIEEELKRIQHESI